MVRVRGVGGVAATSLVHFARKTQHVSGKFGSFNTYLKGPVAHD